MTLKHLVFASLLLFCSCNGICQTSTAKHVCKDNCCKDDKKKSSTTQTETVKTMGIETKKPMTCKLTSPELQKRKQEVLVSLKQKMLEKKELSNGYSYLFKSVDENIDEITKFIKTEHTCCDFFSFKMSVESENLWLTITGEEGVKDFIKNELEL